jgi:hypothetical protein
MKIVKIIGGLGNQMFQYAFYKSLENQFSNVKADILEFKNYSLHNGYELENIFDVHLYYSSNFENLILGGSNTIFGKFWKKVGQFTKFYYTEKKVGSFDSAIFKNKANTYYYGYWQNENYFCNITEQIRNAFIFKNPLDKQNLQIKNLIENSNSVSIHIRRGDYVNNAAYRCLQNNNYYLNALKYLQTKLKGMVYFVFSDDIAWCRHNIILDNCYYIDWNKGAFSYIDMQLMSCCRHNIIANSSFSWWAAWLNSNSDKIVIAPKIWFNTDENDSKNIIPNNWIRI